MTKKIIDYTKTIFYRIVCNDLNIKDCYVGHTTNFTKRKISHKSKCNKETDKVYNNYKYQFIRDNGGWCNWSMIMIEEIQCENKLDAVRQERKFIEEYQATLNKVIPNRSDKEYREDNKNKINERAKEYNKNNKDKILNYRKQYNKEKCKQLIFCDCCKIDINYNTKARHYKTMKHIKNLSTEVVI
jgi:hypothetical protein